MNSELPKPTPLKVLAQRKGLFVNCYDFVGQTEKEAYAQGVHERGRQTLNNSNKLNMAPSSTQL